MKLTIIGTGYVGLVTGACFAEMGNTVHCVDIDKEKIENLKKAILPIYENHLQSMVERNIEKENIFFTTQLEEALKESEICFIAVGTPMAEDGSANLQSVYQVAKNIGQTINHDIIVVDKSTVPVGTGEKVTQIIQKELDKRQVNYNFEVVSNPEFLKEGVAIEDSMRPDRIIIGCEKQETINKMKQLYRPFVHRKERFIIMDRKSAEMTKYASNAMLATRISFMNEIANICEKVGANVNQVRLGVGSDNRIGDRFLYPGCGYGGSCFPKDVQALIHTAQKNNYQAELLEKVETVNKKQKKVLVQKVLKRFNNNIKNLTIAIWGLSFKPETDDMREAPSITIIQELTKKGAKIQAYDPQAINEAQNNYLKNTPNIRYTHNAYQALKDADALILVTEWKEFRSPDFKRMETLMKQKILFDGRNQFNHPTLQEQGFEYYQIGN